MSSALQSEPNLANAEEIHCCFLAFNERGKRLRGFALVGDILAVALSIPGLVTLASRPILVLALAISGVLFRLRADRLAGNAQVWRRLSIRALAHGVDVDPATKSRTLADVPVSLRSGQRAARFKPLRTYYQPTLPPGSRLREVYAHSAFYTYRLLAMESWIAITFSIIVLAGGFAYVYELALDTTTNTVTREHALDAICSTVLVVFALRALEVGVTARGFSADARVLCDELLSPSAVQSEIASDAAREYDLLRTQIPEVPTWLYSLTNARLADAWDRRREALTSDGTTSARESPSAADPGS